MATRGQGVEQAPDDAVRVLVVAHEDDDAEQHQRHGPVEVQSLGGRLQDLLDVAQVGVEIVGSALRRAGEQGLGMTQDERAVVYVDDLRVRGCPLDDLMGVVDHGQAGADVQELADPHLASQMAHRAPEERPVGQGVVHDARVELPDLVTRCLVDGVVVLAAQPVVPDPCRVRPAGIDSAVLTAGACVACHGPLS